MKERKNYASTMRERRQKRKKKNIHKRKKLYYEREKGRKLLKEK